MNIHPAVQLLAYKFSVQVSLNEIKKLSDVSSIEDFNAAIIEILKKVTALESVSDKLENCLLIVQIITIRGGFIPEKFHNYIVFTKNKLIDPKEYDKLIQNFNPADWGELAARSLNRSPTENQDMNSFLFHLRNMDYYCYIDLINYYDKLTKIEEIKEQLFLYAFYGVIIILIIIALNYF